MNHPFIQMLRFEWKSNYMLWLFNLIISTTLLIILFSQMNQGGYIFWQIIFPIFTLLSSLFTLNSYQESIKSQSMQMYHLIPVSRTMKFLSKQFITLIAFPLVLFTLTYAFVILANAFLDRQIIINSSALHQYSILFLLRIWILFHSICTLLAILFKKNKLIYSILAVIATKFILGLLLFIFFWIAFSDKITSSFNTISVDKFRELPDVGFLFIVLIFYTISYRLFIRRQL